ncbi:hypothetical protein ACF0H5_000402 [Mactra antiquata]
MYKQKECKIPQIENGEISSDGEEVGSKLTLTCNEFYMVKDDIDESYCTPRGEWEPAVECERVPGCIELPDIQNGEIVGDNTELGSIVSVTCNQYYEAKDGISQSVCTSGGWDPTLECIPIQGICDELDILTDLVLAEENGTAAGSVRKYSCEPDFVDIETSLTWTCQPAGNWDGKASKCVPKICTDVRCYAVYKGEAIVETATIRVEADTPEICISKCEEMMDDDLKSILYKTDKMLDQLNYCVSLPEVENGKFLGNCRSVGSKLSAKCVRYYKPKNDIKHTFCTAKGTWEPSTECIPMRKCKVPKIENGEVSSKGEEVGSKLTLTCYEFYLVKDDIDESYCTPRGEWEPAVACERVPGCVELPEIQNGEIVGENTELGSIVSVTCNRYYEAKDGISQSVCTSGGWDSTLECIPIQGICDELDIPANLTLAEANGTAVGSIRQFACKPDFVDIETSLTWTCQPAGNWDGKASKCVPKFCTDMRCYAIYEGVGIPDISTTREKADTSGNCISKCEELMGDNLKSIVYNADNRLDPRNCKCYKTAWTAGDLLMQWDTCYSYFSY